MKVKPKSVSVNIPIIMQFSDYHEIYDLLEYFNEIFNKKIKVEELFSNNGYYHAIFYFKKDKEYKSLVKVHENSMDEEYES